MFKKRETIMTHNRTNGTCRMVSERGAGRGTGEGQEGRGPERKGSRESWGKVRQKRAIAWLEAIEIPTWLSHFDFP